MALNIKELIAAQQKLAKEDAKGANQERISIADFKKMVGMQESGSKKQVELLANIETLSIQNNETQKEQVETEKTLVEKEDGSHARLDSIKATLDKTLNESKNQTKTLEKLEKTGSAKLSMESTVESERDRQESLKALKEISAKLDGKGEKEEKKKDESGGLGLGGIATAIAVALGAIVGAISGYVKAIIKMNKLLFGAIESAIVGLGKFFPSLKRILFNIETTFVLGMQMIKEAFGNFIQKALKVFDSVKDFIGGILSKIMNSDVMKTVVGTFQKVVLGVKNFFAPISDAFKVLEETASPVSKAIGFVKDKIGTFFSFFDDIGSKLGMFGKIFGAVAKIVSKIAFPLTIIMAIWDTVKGALEGFEKEGIIGGIAGAIKGLISSLITAPIDMLKDGISWILDMFGFDKASKFLDSFSFDDMMKGFVDAIFHPVDTIKKMFEGIMDFFYGIEIPEIGFTIPVINKKVSIGPFRPFKKEAASASPSANTSTPSKAKVEDTAGAKAPAPATGTEVAKAKESANKTAVKESRAPGDTRVTPQTTTPDTKVNVNVESAKTADLVKNEAYSTAYDSAIAAGKTPKEAEAIAQKASQITSVPLASPVNTAGATAPTPKEANMVYNKSADNATAAVDNNKSSAPVIVNAPTNVNNNTSKQNIAMPSPTRNTDRGLGAYVQKNTMFI
jgi:hypothetical protein